MKPKPIIIKRYSRNLFISASALCLCPLSVNINAEPSSDFALEEIVVSAQRREESLQEVPASISAFTSENLEVARIQDAKGYFLQTPNVSFQEAGRSGQRSVDIAIRGISNIGGNVNAFGVYMDEFNIAHVAQQGAVNPQLEDVERIEVLRGPQGTFFGRNATGGALNITTKKPGPDLYGELQASFGRYGTRGTTGIINVPIVEDKFFVRAVASYEESDGFVKNVNPAGGRSDYEFQNLRLSARWLVTENFTVDASINQMTEDSGLNPLVPTEVLDEDTASIVGTTVPVSDGLPFFPRNTTRVNHDLPLNQENETTIANLRLTYEGDGFIVKSVTGYIDSERDFLGDLDFSSMGFFEQELLDKADSWSQEIRVQSDNESNLEWVVGALYAEDERDDFAGVRAGPGAFFGLPDQFPIDINFDKESTESWAVFGQTTWRGIDNLAITLGARYSHDDVEISHTGIGFGTPEPLSKSEASFKDFSPKLSVAYDWSEDVMTYFTISKGFKAGGIELNTSIPEDSFDEETLWNYELGIRTYLADRRFMVNATLFYMDWKDLQVSSFETIVDPVTSAISFIDRTLNAASAESYGLELEFAAQLTEQFKIGGSVGLLNAEFDDFPDANIVGQRVDLSGEDMIRSPDVTAHLNAQYNVPLESLGGLSSPEFFARAEWSYRSETVPNIEAITQSGFPNETPSFSIANFRAGIASDSFRFEVFVENAFEDDYFTGQSNFGVSGIRVRPHPRIWGTRLTYKFQ